MRIRVILPQRIGIPLNREPHGLRHTGEELRDSPIRIHQVLKSREWDESGESNRWRIVLRVACLDAKSSAKDVPFLVKEGINTAIKPFGIIEAIR